MEWQLITVTGGRLRRAKGCSGSLEIEHSINDQAAPSNRKIGIESAEGVLGLEPACFNRRAGDVVLAQWPSVPQFLREVW